MRKITLSTGAAVLALLLAGPAWSITAGPDDFGYTAADEASGVTYTWVDMSSGTDITSTMDDDDQSTAIPLGFSFTFYGETFTSVYILSNGVLVFDPLTSAGYSPFHGTQCPLPQEDEVDGMIAFYQRDFDPAASACGTDCWIRHASGGTAPNRWWGVTFNRVVIYRDTGSTEDPDPVTVQAILYEDSSIKVQVQDPGVKEGEDTMLGVEAQDGVSGLSFPGCLATGYTHADMAVEFTPPTGGTPIVPIQRVGWARPGNTVTHDFTAFNIEPSSVTFTVSAAGGTWITTPSVTTLTVAPGASQAFAVAVNIPGTAVGGDSDVSTITLHPTSGGAGDKTVTVTTLVQDEALAWQRVSYMPITVDRPAVAVLGNDIYVISGLQYDALSVQMTIMISFQILHMDMLVWDHSDAATGGTLDELEFGVYLGDACAMNDHIYVLAGRTGATAEPLIWDTLFIYDATAGTWSPSATLPEARFGGAVVCDATNDTLYIIGGYGPFDPVEETAYPQNTIWTYDPGTDSFDTTLGAMPGTRVIHEAELIDADTILVAGGYFDDFLSTRTDLYEISTDTWTRTGDLPWERLYFGSGILPTGRMCLFGGSSFADWPTTLLEDTYDCYSDGYWIPQVSNMTEALTYVVGVTLDDRLYAVGGAETDTLGWPPTSYSQSARVERYPTGPLPDVSIDTGVDTAGDTDDDLPGDVTIDVPPDGETDSPTDGPIDVPSEGDGGGDKGCGCSIVS